MHRRARGSCDRLRLAAEAGSSLTRHRSVRPSATARGISPRAKAPPRGTRVTMIFSRPLVTRPACQRYVSLSSRWPQVHDAPLQGPLGQQALPCRGSTVLLADARLSFRPAPGDPCIAWQEVPGVMSGSRPSGAHRHRRGRSSANLRWACGWTVRQHPAVLFRIVFSPAKADRHEWRLLGAAARGMRPEELRTRTRKEGSGANCRPAPLRSAGEEAGRCG